MTVLTELHEDSDQWYNLGLALNLTPGALDAIKGQYKDPKECLRDAVKAWLNMSPDPSWKAIVHALRSTIVGRDSSARRLEQEYCMQQQSEPPAGKNDHGNACSHFVCLADYSRSLGRNIH